MRNKSGIPDFSFEIPLWEKGFEFVAGVDEVGRGAFAGSVVAGAVEFPLVGHVVRSARPCHPSNFNVVINDSKQLKAQQREVAAIWIKENALSWGIGEAGVGTINRLGIVNATRMAMRKAIKEANLRLRQKDYDLQRNKVSVARGLQAVDFLLIDAFYIPRVRGLWKNRQLPIAGGDSKSFSIAAASIIAKVYRDILMRKLSKRYAYYGWDKNKGYGTQEHQKAILRYGTTVLHRTVFVETWENNLKLKTTT